MFLIIHHGFGFVEMVVKIMADCFFMFLIGRDENVINIIY